MVAFVALAFALALAPTAAVFLAACFAVGVLTSAIQMLVPVAASLHRGRVFGRVMSGLMLSILLPRLIAGLVTQACD